MKKSLLILALSGSLSCSEEDHSISKNKSFEPIYQPSIDYERLSFDVAKWTVDGTIDSTERIEILRKSGYNIKTCYGWFSRGIYVHDGKDWVNITNNINDLPLEINANFITSYQK